MVTRIISTNVGIPTPVANVVLEPGANSLIWVLQGVSGVSTGSSILTSGGQDVVTIDGSLASIGANGVELGISGVAASGGNVLTLGAMSSIIAANQGIVTFGGADVITIKGSVTSGGQGVVLGTAGANATGDNTLTLTATGSINSKLDAIVDQIGAARITIDGAVNAWLHGVVLNVGSSLSLGASGIITSTVGIEAANFSTHISNAGTVAAKADGVLATFDTTLVNTGVISGAFAFRGLTSGNDVLNRGTMAGNLSLAGGGNRVSNEGSVFGFVDLQNSSNKFMNSGSVTSDQGALFMGSAQFGATNNRVVNSGDLLGSQTGVSFAGSGTINNSGSIIGGTTSISLFDDSTAHAVTIHNTGTIGQSPGSIAIDSGSFTAGTVQLWNHRAGNIVGSVVDIAGDMSIHNTGSIQGQISLSFGNDSYDGRGGTVSGIISGGAGFDSLVGGAGEETMDGGLDTDILRGGGGDDDLSGGSGADLLSGGADDDTLSGGADNDLVGGGTGDDLFIASSSDGDDTYSGGAGTDTLDNSFAINNLTVNLAAGMAFGSQIGSDTLIDIENAKGGSGFDSLVGDEGVNLLEGNDGVDTLIGDDGRDTLDGGAGADTITGGAGKDWLTGGKDGDRFIYNALSESTVVVGGRDVITDFVEFNISSIDRDRISLASIDWDTVTAGDQAFSFIGLAAFVAGSSAGKLHYIKTGGTTVVEVEVNNDGIADMAIVLQGTHTLTGADFVL